MNSERLLELYDRISDAPDAVSRLRRFILDLAVRGKLVDQDPEDEPTLEQLPIEAQTQAPTNFPKDWRQARIGDLLTFHYGKGLKKSERLEAGPVPVFGSNGVVGFTDTALCSAPAIIVGRKGSAGALNICDGPSWTTDVAYFIEPPEFYALRFLYMALSTLDLDTLGKGVKPGLSRADAYELLLPVPPISEQHRIVAKVDELMALCDRLQKTHNTREATRDRLTTASLTRLTATDTDEQTFQSHARFALDALPALTNRPDQVKTLRQTILDLAVSGELVEQDAKDGTGEELLKQLEKTGEKFQKNNHTRRRKNAGDHHKAEGYLNLPINWSWARINQVGATQTGATPSSSNPEFFGDDIPFVKPADLDGDQIRVDGAGLTQVGMCHSRLAPKHTVFMVCIGASLGKVNIANREICFNQQINAVTPYVEGLHRFVGLALKASNFQRLAWSKAGTGTLPIISKGKWEILPVPLPPLAEQHRIVAKVDELMALCDQLEVSLTKADTARRRLLESMLHEALHPAADELGAA